MNLSRILCTFSGDDYSIIIQSNRTIQNRFMVIGSFVTAIFAACFISCYFTFTKLFQNYFIGIPIGLFFSYMITNIYLLLLYTLSKNSFPCKTDKVSELFSIAIRVVFICFIAIIVSKPIETIVFKAPLEYEIAEYKQLQIQKYIQTTNKYFKDEIGKLKFEISEHEKISEYTNAEQLVNCKNRLHKKELQKAELIASMIQLVSNSNFYIQSIVILNKKYGTCWLITLFTMFIFLFPAYLKNFLGKQSFYYETKRTIENRLVKEEYDIFKKRYKELFISKIISEMQYPNKEKEKGILEEKVNIHNSMIKNIQFSESFINAPFNTIRKTDEREFLKEDDLISDLYNV
jgi:hypothetical protein